ncbi:MAG: SDR family oxidoreductase [Candidatus Neomarinimicrobiota bacterium]|nr:SDR family oxidoreductase [Candidatus Neomarinimicrobiota bacterium]MEC9105935.1 SDR family oxidoreductase [Candidatus Neomarinimicrobiota bacterium]MED5265968.1 SDR family oxidoreductase [Candidatus Neomarinimicrobiota bacterium]
MNKVAIITAAGKGMGAACARTLSKENYKLVLMSRTENVLELASDLNAVGMVGDVTNQNDLSKVVDLALDSYGQIDAIVNNTGHPPKGDLLKITDSEWKEAFDLLLLNVVRISRLVVPIMKKNGGTIVNISSYSAKDPNLSFPTSSTIRAGLSAFVKLFADQYAKDGIRMNNILPGFIDSFDVSDEIRSTIPSKREGKVDEIANTVVFLLSNKSSYITGQNIRVDGGLGRSI